MYWRKHREIELDNGKTIIYKLEIIDSFKFMSTSLSKLVDNSLKFNAKNVEIKKCKCDYEFKGLKDNKLSDNC